MPFHQTIVKIKVMARKLHFRGCYADPVVAIETNGFQEIYADFLSDGGLDVKSMKNTTDKRSRAALLGPSIFDGSILFPRHGAEDLISQLTGLGRERHDDLADALVMMYIGALEALQDTRSWKSCLDDGGPIFFV
jgi:predicted phage terminase large subunit-like protein